MYSGRATIPTTNLLFFSAPDSFESSMEHFAIEESSCGLHCDAKENHARGVSRVTVPRCYAWHSEP